MAKLGQYTSWSNWWGDTIVRKGRDGRYFRLTPDQQSRVIDRIVWLSAKGTEEGWVQNRFDERHKLRSLSRLCDFAVGDEWL